MGMFSTVLNSCEKIGPDMLGELQTKDFENVMDYYWLDPNGCLFLLDYSNCFDLEVDKDSCSWLNFLKYEPTGVRGKIKPYRRTLIARLYTANGGWKEVHALFELGRFHSIIPDEDVYYSYD